MAATVNEVGRAVSTGRRIPLSEFRLAERLARTVRRRVDVAQGEVVSSLAMAHRLLGVPVRLDPGLPTLGCIRFLVDPPRILIRELSREAHFIVAHEIGHWALRELAGFPIHPHEEDLSDFFAAALTMPLRLLGRLEATHSENGIMDALGVSEGQLQFRRAGRAHLRRGTAETFAALESASVCVHHEYRELRARFDARGGLSA